LKIDLSKYDKLSDKQWKDKVIYRGLHIKYKHQLNKLKKLYPKKIETLQDRLKFLQFDTEKPEFDKTLKLVEIFDLEFCLNKQLSELENIVNDKVEFLNNKIERIVDKYAATLKEIELRDKKLVKRTPKGTVYYIDLNAGDDGLDGLTTGNAWLTLNKYTTVEARTPGDIAKVRAGTSQIFAGNLALDEDGNVDNLITIKGCSVADDPWSDSSDVRPILDFNDTTYLVYSAGDHRWKFQNLDFKGGNSTTDACVSIDSNNTFFDNCRIYENGSTGLLLKGNNGAEIRDCEFYSNVGINLSIGDIGNLSIIGCTFNGGTDTTNYGIYYNNRVEPLVLIDCSFGQTTTHDTVDIRLLSNGNLIMRNCVYNSITYYDYYNTDKGQKLRSEDDGQVFEVHKTNTYDVTLERDTVVTRPGGADSSLKMTPSSRVGLYNKVSSSGGQGEIVRGTFRIWLQADVEKTINIYIKGFGWTGFPTVAQLFVRASYLSNAGNANRTEIDSDEVIANNVDWVPFQVTLTPARTGFVYVDAFIAHYEASSGINIDIDTSNIT